MKYKVLGKTGLKVSSLCLGTMTFGDGADRAASKKIYSLARDKGINIFDCANVYANGESERILGKLIHGHRDQTILATKAFFPTSKKINDRGSSRFHLTKALEGSLMRLGTDYVDIYYLHNFDENTTLEESLSTLNDFVRQGKVLYLGLSNFAAWQVMKAIAISEYRNYASITCIQPMYNLLKRQCETEILPMAKHEAIGVFSYSPLAGGLLTGKYLSKKEDTGRFDTNEMYQNRYQDAINKKSVKAFVNFANQNRYNPISLAIAWTGGHSAISAPIVGARNVEQLIPALDSLDIKMTMELRNTISGFTPNPAPANDRSEEK